jgi:hypothetical protein
MSGEKFSMRFCLHGRHMKPRNEFRVLPGLRARREVCESCYQTIMAARERVKKPLETA